MSIQVEYATPALLGRAHSVLRQKLATVIATRPTDTTGFFADLPGLGVGVHLPTPTMRLAPKSSVPYTVNEDAVVFIYHGDDRAPGIRNTGGTTYYLETNSTITLGFYIRLLWASDVYEGGTSVTREPPTTSGTEQTSREVQFYRAELYAGAIEYAMMKWGQGGGQIYDIRKTLHEAGEDDEPQRHAFVRIEFECVQELQIPVNTYDLT